MAMMSLRTIDRRHCLRAGAAAAIVAALARHGTAAQGFAGLRERLAAIKAQSGGRLGVAVFDTGTGARADWRGAERFPLCSTFKLLAGAALLSRVDAGREALNRKINYETRDLVPYSPVTKLHVGAGMTLAELCEAAITQSDNTAGNLILADIGGPSGLTT
jgi:beta-lactamase class A